MIKIKNRNISSILLDISDLSYYICFSEGNKAGSDNKNKMITTITIKEVEKVYRNLGFTEEVTTCDCCGKVDLKGTYAIENMMTGDIMYFGCVCAANKMNWSKKEFVTKYKAEEKEQSDAARAEYRNSEEMKSYNNWVANLPDTATDKGWEERMSLLKSEGPFYKNALETKKIELQGKYPLAKYIY